VIVTRLRIGQSRNRVLNPGMDGRGEGGVQYVFLFSKS
jgi:hypothetical protein